MSRKVFTAGEVLAAADVNSFLMDQTVMSFAGTAARGSAIPSPVEGMTTYLEDSDRLDSYTGSAWVPATGLTFLKSETFSGVTAVNFNSIFSSLYRDYLFIFTGTNSSAANVHWRTRLATTDNSTANYTSGSVLISESSGPTRSYEAGSTWSRIGQLQIYRSMFSFLVCDPFITTTTVSNAQITSFGNNDTLGSTWGYKSDAASYDGISFIVSSGTMTGTIKAYGYRS